MAAKKKAARKPKPKDLGSGLAKKAGKKLKGRSAQLKKKLSKYKY